MKTQRNYLKSYAEDGGDLISLSLLRLIIDKKYKYVDIGANHPIINNETYLKN